ncbi:unnamed protein product [Cuscuta epithymum]|uniref:Uncharacterized protein n=1 Tax=Cuscuta epithymum TaxID=186058 RepID=A0AAV0C1P7_9ASTE|nr:unnamed protein product [Cuscuta epithymum]
MENVPALLHIPGAGRPGPGPVVPAAVQALLGSDWASLDGPPHLLRVGGPDPAVHQRVQVPEAVPQADPGRGDGAAAAAEDADKRRRRRGGGGV